MKNEALKHGIFDNLDNNQAYELKDAYYNVACNIQPTIEALELAILNEQSTIRICKCKSIIQAIETELKLYRQIKALADRSQLGAIL